jgi:hypothetical protein
MLKRFGGIQRIVKSSDFKLAIIFASILAIICGYLSISRDIIFALSPILITVGAALVAVIITGLAIIVSTSDDDFIHLLTDIKIYENILFPFWLSAIISGASIVVNIISYIAISIVRPILIISVNAINLNNYIYTCLLWLSFLFTFYALFSIISLIENAIKYGLYRSEIIELSSTQLEGIEEIFD